MGHGNFHTYKQIKIPQSQIKREPPVQEKQSINLSHFGANMFSDNPQIRQAVNASNDSSQMLHPHPQEAY
jgi:hemoglobin-like flavoprotein